MVWSYDPIHSSVFCTARHLRIAFVRGVFRKVEAKLDLEAPDPTGWSADVTIDAASIDTGVEMRDEDLRGPNHLNVAEFPTMSFVSKRVEPRGGSDYSLVGDLTIRGVTKEVALAMRYNGEITDPRNTTRRGFDCEVKLRRTDFGMKVALPLPPPWNEGTVADELDVSIEVEAIQGEIRPW